MSIEEDVDVRESAEDNANLDNEDELLPSDWLLMPPPVIVVFSAGSAAICNFSLIKATRRCKLSTSRAEQSAPSNKSRNDTPSFDSWSMLKHLWMSATEIRSSMVLSDISSREVKESPHL